MEPIILDADPYFSEEAQETFTAGDAIFVLDSSEVVGRYLGRLSRGSDDYAVLVHFDGDHDPVRVEFDTIRNIYR